MAILLVLPTGKELLTDAPRRPARGAITNAEFVSAARAQIAEDLPKCLASGALVRCGGCAGAGDDVA
jgi:hypothetical protein